MDKISADQMVADEIQKMIDVMMPNGGGAAMTEVRLRTALQHVAQKAFSFGQSYALLSLKTSADLAEEFGVSLRRVQAIAKTQHDRYAIGFQVPGKNPWLFTPTEVEQLRPGKPGKRKKFIHDSPKDT